MGLVNRTCPSCIVETPTEPFGSCSNFSYLDIVKPWYPNSKFMYVKCKVCGTVFVPVVPEPGVVNSLYQGEGARRWWQNYLSSQRKRLPWIKRIMFENGRFDPRYKIITRIQRFVAKPARLIDVGCGAGDFLAVAKKFCSSVEGVEINPLTANYVKEQLGIPVYTVPVELMESPGEPYDVVVLNQVIEHVSFPVELLRACNRLLRPGGILYIGCPNIDALSVRFFGLRHIHFGLHHINMFNARSFRSLMQQSGFIPLVVRAEILDVRVGDVLIWALNRKRFIHRNNPPRRLSGWVSRITDGLLGDLWSRCGSYLWGIFRRGD